VSVIDFLPEGGNRDEVGKWFEDGSWPHFLRREWGFLFLRPTIQRRW